MESAFAKHPRMDGIADTPEPSPGPLQRLSVRAKLMLMMVVSAASMLFLGAFFLSSINEVKVSGPIYEAIAREMDLRSDILPPPEFIVETHLTALQIENALRSNPKQVDALVKNLDGLKHDYDDRQAYWEKTLPSETPLEIQIRDGILHASNDPASKYFQILTDQFLPAVRRGNVNKADAIIDAQLEPLYVQHKAAIQRLADPTQKSQDLRVQDAKSKIASRITILITVIVLSCLLTFVVGLYASHSITGPLKNAVEALQQVAGRDLTPHLIVRNQDEVGAMADAFNIATVAIRTGFSEAGEIARVVSGASFELEGAAKQLSDGTQSQAAGLEETSASLEQLTATVKQNAEHAVEARELSNAASNNAFVGTGVIDSAIQAMGEISVASVKIGEITASIDEIAFHTNILAVNAAIEAARAGEQGLGFAVVATEVRSLAQRSAASAREIKHLIRDTVTKVENGSNHVTRSGETLHEIAKSIKQVAEVVSGISNACSEQAIAIENVNLAVSRVDSVTQKNTAQSEQLFATARQLLSKSGELQEMVSSFDIGSQPTSGSLLSMPASQPVVFRPRPAFAGTASRNDRN